MTGSFYVGSTVDARVRFQTHKRRLRAGKHQSPKMQAAWNKYGEDCFKFEIIEHVDKAEDLLKAEQIWLDAHAGKDYCYNWATDASAPMRGKTHTEAVRVKLKESAQKVPKGKNSPLYGVPRTDEVKAKLSVALKGKENKMKGKSLSAQGKANITAAIKRGSDSHFYGKPPVHLEELKKAIHAVLPDRTEKVFSSLTELRDICGVPIATIIRACKSGKPVRSGTVAGWVLSYQGAEINTAPEIPVEYLEYPRTRKLAMDAGVKFYFTGIPCERGHTALRLVKGTCELCRKEDWKKENDRRKHKPK